MAVLLSCPNLGCAARTAAERSVMKKIVSILLTAVLLLGIMPAGIFAAPTLDEAMADVDVYAKSEDLDWLAMNGSVKIQHYTYYNYQSKLTNEVKEIPAYCIDPNLYGVPALVPEGTPIKYSATELVKDPKIGNLVAYGYPRWPLDSLGLQTKEEGYYATKTALWCYILRGSWSIHRLGINPSLTGSDLEAARRVLDAAKLIYSRGMAASDLPSAALFATPDRTSAYPVTLDGKQYLQQIFTINSATWPVERVRLSLEGQVPAGTIIADMTGQQIDSVVVDQSGPEGFQAQVRVLFPASAVGETSGTATLKMTGVVSQLLLYYAVSLEKDAYGNIQDYILDTDPITPIEAAAVASYTGSGTDSPEEGQTLLKIVKVEAGTQIPLEGAVFHVTAPDGTSAGYFTTGPDGTVTVPFIVAGHVTVEETEPPKWHLLDKDPTKHAQIVHGETTTVVFANEPYGDLRVEKLSDTGAPLKGVTIQIKHIRTGQTQSKQTNSAGTAYFDHLEPGGYEVKEVAGIPGWIADTDTVQTVSVVAGRRSDVTITNKELPGLRIVKYDRKTMTLLPKVTFAVYRDGKFLGNFQTDAFGEILLPDAQPGTYRAFEVDTGDEGLILDTTPQEIELRAGDVIRELLFFNDTKPGMRLVKVDSADPSKPISDAVFEIKSVKGDYGPKEFRTDQNGEIDLSALPAGAYVVTEKSCPGYVIDDAQRIVHLDPNEDAQFVFTNSKLPSLHLIKTSSDGAPLKGVSFRLAKIEDGSHYLDRTTDANGEILWEGLEPGVYSLKEISTLPDHIADPTEHHIQLFPGKVSEKVLANDKRPDLYIYKYDADTGAPVPETVFLVKAADGHSVGEVKTDSQGKGVLKDLLPGVYEISEKSVPSPYLKDAEPQLVTLYPNVDRAVYFEDHKAPTIEILKEDSITHQPLAGVRFQVWYGSNHTSTGELNDLGVFTTDENGRIQLTGPANGLRDGWFRVKELAPPKGYSVKDSDTQEAFVAAGKNHTFRFENTPLSALIVYKYDSKTGKALEGAVFQVKYLGGSASGTGGTVIGTYKTGPGGSFTVAGLQAGTYVVSEVASDSDHVIDTAPQTAYISGKDQDVVQLYFGNSPKGALLVKKVDASTGEPLSDVEFMVTRSDGSVVGDANGKFVTDSAGSFTVSGIEPGTTLVVKETRAKDGYLLDDTPQTAQIKAGQTVTLEFRDQPLGGLIIHKLDSKTKEPLAGVQFKITYADGKVVDNGKLSSNGLYRTDKNGQIVLSGITGTLIVTEVQTIEGYKIDPDTRSQTVEIRPDDTQELWFYNDPCSGIVLHKIDSVTGEGIYGVKFLVYDQNKRPIGEYSTDDEGYIYIDDLTVQGKGKLFIRELEAAPGYELDKEYKTVYVQPGKTIEVTWENTPITGQFQIWKYAAEHNEITGTPAGTPLQGAVYEISEARSGKVVDHITTDARGVAASRPLPLGRYKIVEVTAPAYWQLSGKTFDETLEHSGQIIKVSDYDKPSNLGVVITKRGNAEVLAGTQMRYGFTVANTSNVPLSEFYWHDRIPTDAARATVLTTGTYSARLNYRILYKTNYTSGYQVLASNLLTSNDYSFSLNAIPVQAGEYVTDVYFEFGKVPVGFQSTSSPTLTVQVLGTIVNGYQIVNRADVGGKYQGTWQTAQASWVTIVRKLVTTVIPTLPKTGY